MKELTTVLEELIPVVKEAGDRIAEAKVSRVQEKSSSKDLVTEYDVATQRFLREKLTAILPDAGFLGEEEGQKEDLEAMDVFVVDPIDGTSNFIFDYHHSCISVGLKRGDAIALGLIYNPWDKGMYTAIRGQGAYLNGERLHVSELPMSKGLTNLGTAPYYADIRKLSMKMAAEAIEHSLDIRRRGSAALDLCDAAAGRCGVYCELILQPWDMAAGSLLVEEAGGVVTDEKGKPLTWNKASGVVAGGKAACEEMRQILSGIL